MTFFTLGKLGLRVAKCLVAGLFVFPAALSLGLGGCAYEKADDIKPVEQPACGDTLAVTYATVKPIFDNNCTSCHGQINPQNGAQLWNYAGAKLYTQGGDVVQRITHNPSYQPGQWMPQTTRTSGIPAPKLSACDIAKIRRWKALGCPEN